jgi:TM2 domain-containing membrane protein YozV
MSENTSENNIPDKELDSLKEQIKDLKKKKEIEELKAEVDSLKNENETIKKKKEIKSLQAEVESLSPQSSQYSSSTEASKYSDPSWDEIKSKRTTAGILGIFFGYFGVHKFILGYKNEGFIYLGVTIFGGIITCGIAAIVTSIICVIEGIIYLTKTPEEFKRLYIDKKTGWF